MNKQNADVAEVMRGRTICLSEQHAYSLTRLVKWFKTFCDAGNIPNEEGRSDQLTSGYCNELLEALGCGEDERLTIKKGSAVGHTEIQPGILGTCCVCNLPIVDKSKPMQVAIKGCQCEKPVIAGQSGEGM